MSEEMVSKLLEIAKDGTIVMGKQLDALSTQLINYFIFVNVLELGKHLLVGVITFIIVKMLKTAIWAREQQVTLLPSKFNDEAAEEEGKIKRAGLNLEVALFRYATYIVILGSGAYIVSTAFNPIKQIGKLVYAPHIFLIEKATELTKTGELKE